MPKGQKNPHAVRCVVHPQRFGIYNLPVCEDCGGRLLVMLLSRLSVDEQVQLLEVLRGPRA